MTKRTYSIRYGFSQPFKVAAADAYKWATDYQPDDLRLMGGEVRRIQHLADDAVILTDTYRIDGREVTKEKLVTLYPDRLYWVSTHINGPTKHSQFLYQIVPEGKNASRIDFTGVQIDYTDEEYAPERIAARAKQLTDEDSTDWKSIARAMELDLNAEK